MRPDLNRVEQARVRYEEHVRGCRYCPGETAACQSAKLLRRVYNNLLRTEREGRPAAGGHP